jgi:KaiC/GvpD/RAD55 family RecA-like ATPase
MLPKSKSLKMFLKRSAGVLIADRLYARSECHNQINNNKRKERLCIDSISGFGIYLTKFMMCRKWNSVVFALRKYFATKIFQVGENFQCDRRQQSLF